MSRGVPRTGLSTGAVSMATDPHGAGSRGARNRYRQLGNKSASAQRFCLRLSEIRPVAEEVKCGAGGGADIRSAPGRGR